MVFHSARSLPDLKQWDELSRDACEQVAMDLTQRLPETFHYVKLEHHALGVQQHTIAIFSWSPSERAEALQFAFLPGGTATLGYDRNHPFVPTSAQHKSWQEETVGRGYSTETLHAFLDQVMTPFRQVNIEPMFIQVIATNPRKPPYIDAHGNYRHPNFVVRAEIEAQLAQEGFRLPSSDEWEYACGAGSRALFRWGNETPDEHAWRPEDNEDIPTGYWDTHWKPNAFGLTIARDPYQWEFCTEVDIMRGGDGGGACHSGAGTFAEWLMLATPLYRRLHERSLQRGGAYGAYFRRVHPLTYLQ